MRTKLVRRLLALLAALLFAAFAAIACYLLDYYRATDEALAALRPDTRVNVVRTSYGWLFDGPASGSALIFYPGAKVGETAYAPFLRQIAAQGLDVCLVKMPFRLAILGEGKAAEVCASHDYADWYIGGHSLGGAMAARYAASHGGQFKGLALCAAYPTDPLGSGQKLIVLYGSEDTVLDKERFAAGMRLAPAGTEVHELRGGNHAQFGDYGPQKGDGAALIPASAQQQEAARLIVAGLLP